MLTNMLERIPELRLGSSAQHAKEIQAHRAEDTVGEGLITVCAGLADPIRVMYLCKNLGKAEEQLELDWERDGSRGGSESEHPHAVDTPDHGAIADGRDGS